MKVDEFTEKNTPSQTEHEFFNSFGFITEF
jgi:hypothetical protein